VRRTPYAYVALIVLSALLSLSALGGAVAYYHSSQRAQQRQGVAIEAKLCATLEPLAGLAGLKPPPGNPADNPSRAFEQQLVVKLAPLAQLGPDLGCGKGSR
jgi:hypothetical protein